MPAGLQVWDASGNLVVDFTTRMGVVIGSVSTGTSNGSISVPDFALGTPFFFAQLESPLSNTSWTASPSVSGATLSWTFEGTGEGLTKQSLLLSYGVY